MLTNLIVNSTKIVKEMERIFAYQMIGTILRRKSHLLTLGILDIIWKIVLMGTDDCEVVTNLFACKRFILDYEIWKACDQDLQRALFSRLNKLVSKESSGYAVWNAQRLRKISEQK